MSIAIIILAAGASTRMGTPKQLLLYQSKSLLCRAIETAIASKCEPIVVVVGANAAQIELEIDRFAVSVVENSHWAEGMGTSIRAGITALADRSPNVEAAIVLLCDQPFVSTQLIHQLMERYYITAQPIIASKYGETLGVPALFDRAFFSKLLALDGTAGARHLIGRYCLDENAYILFPEGQIDIDTPQDYEQLQHLARSTLDRAYALKPHN